MYYYCYRGQRIGEYLTEMPSPNFVELTNEQVAFWREHPNAAAHEVMNCQLNEPYVAPEKTLEEIKSEAIKMIDSKSRETIGLHVDTLALADAMTSLLFAATNAAPAIYDAEKATEVVQNFLTIGKACRDKYHEAIAMINSCDTAEDVAIILNTTINYYDSIGNN